MFESGLQLGVVRIRTVCADGSFESGIFKLDLWHKNEEMMRERSDLRFIACVRGWCSLQSFVLVTAR